MWRSLAEQTQPDNLRQVISKKKSLNGFDAVWADGTSVQEIQNDPREKATAS